MRLGSFAIAAVVPLCALLVSASRPAALTRRLLADGAYPAPWSATLKLQHFDDADLLSGSTHAQPAAVYSATVRAVALNASTVLVRGVGGEETSVPLMETTILHLHDDAHDLHVTAREDGVSNVFAVLLAAALHGMCGHSQPAAAYLLYEPHTQHAVVSCVAAATADSGHFTVMSVVVRPLWVACVCVCACLAWTLTGSRRGCAAGNGQQLEPRRHVAGRSRCGTAAQRRRASPIRA